LFSPFVFPLLLSSPDIDDPTVDRKTWDLLPYLYGVTFSGLANLDSSFFNISVENNENNAVCLALSLNKLTVTIMSLVSTSAEKDVISNFQKTFLEVASTCLLRLSKDRPKELDSVAVILIEVSSSSFTFRFHFVLIFFHLLFYFI
jgi:hypothetical protein